MIKPCPDCGGSGNIWSFRKEIRCSYCEGAGLNSEWFLGDKVRLFHGDCLDVLPSLPECSIDSVVTDPPYHLTSIVKRFGAEGAAPAKSNGTGVYARSSSGFMGQRWDGGDLAFRPETWAAVLRVLKPGGHLLAFGAPKNAHRLTCAIEDAGFEIRDCLMWLFGSGFPKSHNVALAIDRINGEAPRSKAFNMKGRGARAEELDGNGREFLPQYQAKTEAGRRWDGFGTALKPAYEPIILARKPLDGTVAGNALKWGTGALNIDGCRVDVTGQAERNGSLLKPPAQEPGVGRWPANLLHDGSDEVVSGFPETSAGGFPASRGVGGIGNNGHNGQRNLDARQTDSGSAARFYHTSKADSDDRLGSKHPTVKPLDLMQYLVRLITPPKGLVLDPFSGTGTTGEAAFREGFRAILIEREEGYCADVRRRMELALAGPDERQRAIIKAKGLVEEDPGPLFRGQAA